VIDYAHEYRVCDWLKNAFASLHWLQLISSKFIFISYNDSMYARQTLSLVYIYYIINLMFQLLK